jgi:uncharacterized protein (DUF58 family)
LRAVGAEGSIGELAVIADPIEETYPYSGNTEFRHPSGGARFHTSRAQSLREPYLTKLAAHRAELREICARLGWGVSVHRTDGSPAEALLTLRMRLSAPEPGSYRWST